MNEESIATYLKHARMAVPVLLLTALWLWETLHPFFHWPAGRWRHAAHNVALAVLNALLLGLLFGAATVAVAEWTRQSGYGLLQVGNLPTAVEWCLALLLLDAWMYLWHRANHVVPLLWRFHRMHHSDNRMDVTSAARFHTGELAAAGLLRLALIPLLGLHIWQIVTYEILVVAVTQFHHANISLGRLDRWLRAAIVTPDMHKMHHSRLQPEIDSNYSTLFSWWDRLARTFRMRTDVRTIEFGLEEFDDRRWQTVRGMIATPLAPSRKTVKQVEAEPRRRRSSDELVKT